jgi:DNA-binding transcriptional LysR family regulator
MSLRAQLPPLDTLVTFEAAARLLSFTAAARELNLTQAAVSQQIRNLEERLGVKLFERAHRAVTLTSAGREYQHTVSPMLRTLSSATDDIRFAESRPRLTVAADHAVASLLLVHRVQDFLADHPDITLRLVASDNQNECLAPDVQVVLIHGDGQWRGFSSVCFFAETVFPVCSPDYLAGAPRLECAEDLVCHNLLHHGDDQWNWINWRGWLSLNGVDHQAGERRYEVNSYPLLIEAARRGQGIALGWGTLVDNDLAAGRLIKPLDLEVATGHDYYLAWRDTPAAAPEAQAFCRWISQTFSITLPDGFCAHANG